jgi:hypothetical protein
MQNLTKSRLATMRKIAVHNKVKGGVFTAKKIGCHGAALSSLQKIGVVDLAPASLVPQLYWATTQGQWWMVTDEGRKAFASLVDGELDPYRDR